MCHHAFYSFVTKFCKFFLKFFCISLQLSLHIVTTTEAAKKNGVLKKILTQTVADSLWNKQNRTILTADDIRAAPSCLLATPRDTRWNYDAVSKCTAFCLILHWTGTKV